MNHVLFTFHAGLLMTPNADANDHGACVAKRTSFSTSERSWAKSCRMPLRVTVKPKSSGTNSVPIDVAYRGSVARSNAEAMSQAAHHHAVLRRRISKGLYG
jgi:hypothetical protein